MAEVKERVAKWDNLKFFLIFCVVIGHAISYFTGASLIFKWLQAYIYIFHMPAFIFVSGLMMKKVVREKRYDRLFSYLILGFVIKVVNFAAKAISKGSFKIQLTNEDSVAWYAFGIFAFALITMFLQKFEPKFVFILSIVVGVMAGYDKSLGTQFSAMRILTFYPFFLLGFLLDPNDLIEKSKKWYIKLMSFAVLIGTAVLTFFNRENISWLMKLLRGKGPYSDFSKLAECGGLLRLCHYLLAFAFTFALIALTPNIRCFITNIGSRTLSVYSFHMFFIYIAFDFFGLKDLVMKHFPNSFEIIVIAFAAAVLLLTSIKPLNLLLQHLINPPLKKEDKTE